MHYKNLRAEMARNGIVQSDLAHTADVSLQTINRWLVNEPENFPLLKAMKIRNELFPGQDFDYLFADSE